MHEQTEKTNSLLGKLKSENSEPSGFLIKEDLNQSKTERAFEILQRAKELEEQKDFIEAEKLYAEYRDLMVEYNIFERSADYIHDNLMEIPARDILLGLARNDTDVAWKIRDHFMETKEYWPHVLQSLAGIDTKRAWQLRGKMKLAIGQIYYGQSLAGIDTDHAWDQRDKLAKANLNYNETILNSIIGIDTDRAWRIRDKILASDYGNVGVLKSIIGLDSEKAWNLRDMYINSKEPQFSNIIIATLLGLNSEKAWDMRKKKEDENTANYIILSLAGIDDNESWEYREYLCEKYEIDELSYLSSIAGINSQKAWDIRDKYLKNEDEMHRNALGQRLTGNYKSFVWQLQ